jgi:hypothetical protein
MASPFGGAMGSSQSFLKVESREVKVTSCFYKIKLVLSTFKKPRENPPILDK